MPFSSVPTPARRVTSTNRSPRRLRNRRDVQASPVTARSSHPSPSRSTSCGVNASEMPRSARPQGRVTSVNRPPSLRNRRVSPVSSTRPAARSRRVVAARLHCPLVRSDASPRATSAAITAPGFQSVTTRSRSPSRSTSPKSTPRMLRPTASSSGRPTTPRAADSSVNRPAPSLTRRRPKPSARTTQEQVEVTVGVDVREGGSRRRVEPRQARVGRDVGERTTLVEVETARTTRRGQQQVEVGVVVEVDDGRAGIHLRCRRPCVPLARARRPAPHGRRPRRSGCRRSPPRAARVAATRRATPPRRRGTPWARAGRRAGRGRLGLTVGEEADRRQDSHEDKGQPEHRRPRWRPRRGLFHLAMLARGADPCPLTQAAYAIRGRVAPRARSAGPAGPPHTQSVRPLASRSWRPCAPSRPPCCRGACPAAAGTRC